MKNIIFLYVGNKSSYQFEQVFDSHSAFYRVLEWATKIENIEQIQICSINSLLESVNKEIDSFCKANNLTTKDLISVQTEDKWVMKSLINYMAETVSKNKADLAIYVNGSCPFLDIRLTNEVIASHLKYLSEYTFADGYPYGFAPEVISGGTLNILNTLCDGIQKEAGLANVTANGIFSVMKGDVNSFEIETVIAPEDWRQYRLDFSCTNKAEFVASQRLYNLAKKTETIMNAEQLTKLAISSADVQQTVPSYYNIQITPLSYINSKYSPYTDCCKQKFGISPFNTEILTKIKNMSLETFKGLLSEIHSLSDNAVIGLSAWGEPLLHPQFREFVKAILSYPSLSILIETDGSQVTEKLAKEIDDIVNQSPCRDNLENPITWIVYVDAFTEKMFNSVHVTENHNDDKIYNKVIDSVSILNKYFNGNVYPQMLRVNENEEELEQFYRFWHDKNSPSNGKLIIQKYDSFCGLLSDEKPADLSPLKRNPCWHIKREMVILSDGSVPFCKEELLDGNTGNVFNEGIETIWNKLKNRVAQHIEKNYNGKCKNCDEYYTFNF